MITTLYKRDSPASHPLFPMFEMDNSALNISLLTHSKVIQLDPSQVTVLVSDKYIGQCFQAAILTALIYDACKLKSFIEQG